MPFVIHHAIVEVPHRVARALHAFVSPPSFQCPDRCAWSFHARGGEGIRRVRPSIRASHSAAPPWGQVRRARPSILASTRPLHARLPRGFHFEESRVRDLYSGQNSSVVPVPRGILGGVMARPLRIEFVCALYHFTCRGNERRNIGKAFTSHPTSSPATFGPSRPLVRRPG
jgi:hypothetical protein